MNTLPITSLPRSVKRRRPLPVRTTPPGNSGDVGAFCGCVWACRCFAVRFRFLRLSCSGIRSRGFLRRMLRSFRAQACGFCACCSLSRCAICMKYRRAFCAAAGMRCIRRSARWLERAYFASPGFIQSSGQNRPSRCSTMRSRSCGQRRLC